MSLDRRREGVIAPNVQADYGQLQAVVVHSPGEEMLFPPEERNVLLVDSTVDLPLLEYQHDAFCASLETAGAEVLRVEDLAADVCADRAVRLDLAQQLRHLPPLVEKGANPDGSDRVFCYPGLSDNDAYRLAEQFGPEEFVQAFISGRWPNSDTSFVCSDPNTLFSRDMAAVIGPFVILAAFNKPARQREQRLIEVAFQHPMFSQLQVINLPSIDGATFEGGDIMMVNPHLVLIGVSERTNPLAANHLTWVLRDSGIHVVAINFKNDKRREWMHLDTVLSFVSPERFLAYPRMFDPQIPADQRIEVEILRSHDGVLDWDNPAPDLCEVLADYGYTGKPIFIGGPSRIDQNREQYSGATNVITVRPDAFVMYARNHHTIETLRSEGFYVTSDLGDFSDYLEAGRPTVMLIEDSEPFRLGGGPHCMTLPLVRRL